MKLDRKEFLRTALTMVGMGFAVSRVASCGGDGGTSPVSTGGAGTGGGTTNACDTDPPAATIGTNHGHTVTVSQADVTAGAPKMYSIKGTSGHDHTINVSANSFATLKSGGTVTLTSSSVNSHTHTVMIVCA